MCLSRMQTLFILLKWSFLSHKNFLLVSQEWDDFDSVTFYLLSHCAVTTNIGWVVMTFGTKIELLPG